MLLKYHCSLLYPAELYKHTSTTHIHKLNHNSFASVPLLATIKAAVIIQCYEEINTHTYIYFLDRIRGGYPTAIQLASGGCPFPTPNAVPRTDILQHLHISNEPISERCALHIH